MAKSPQAILCDTFGWDISEVKDYRYQDYVGPVVYAIGQEYFAVSKTTPKHDDVGIRWELFNDQFGARGTNQKIWVCKSE